MKINLLAMSVAFLTLCVPATAAPEKIPVIFDTDIGTDVDRILEVLQVLALTDQFRAGTTDVFHEGARIAEREHHCRRSMLQGVR